MRTIKFKYLWKTEWEFVDLYQDNTRYQWELYENRKTSSPFLQYTGLKDKNGVEIFEGDIIKGVIILHDDPFCPVDNEIRLVDEIGQVKFLNGMFLLWNESEYEQGIIIRYDDIEVLGNIYQNPELLEVKEGKES